MRKHFISMEARVEEDVLSLEEEAIVVDEAQQASTEVSADLAEAERIIDVSDALEDLAVIADGIDEATPAEAALIETAGNIAVAGTDVAPEEVIPAMESFIGRKISTEGIRETARNIWENIKKFLKSIWEKIEKFFYKIFGAIPALRRSIADLEKRIDVASDEAKHPGKDKMKISSGVAALSINYVPCKTDAELAKGLLSLSNIGMFVFDRNITDTAKRGEIIADAIKDFDPAKATEGIADLRKKLDATDSGSFPKEGGQDKSRFPGFTTETSAHLLGNVVLASITYDDKADASDLAALDRFRRTRVELMTSAEKPKDVSDFEMLPLSLAGMSKLLTDATKLLDTLEEFKRGSKLKEIQKTRKSIEAASDKAEKAMASAKDSEDASTKAAVPYYKALLNFNAAYARWAQTPAMPVLNHSLTSVRAVLNVCSKSLSTYKVAE